MPLQFAGWEVGSEAGGGLAEEGAALGSHNTTGTFSFAGLLDFSSFFQSQRKNYGPEKESSAFLILTGF